MKTIHLRRLSVAAALAAVLAFLGVEEVAASPYGINAHAPGEASVKKLFRQTHKAGIEWVRIDVVWALVEMETGSRDWRVYDDIVDEARRRNLKILANLAYTPAWATDGPEFSGVPRNPSQWYDFCYAAAKRYGGRIKYWEVWNEPNQPHFWAGTRTQYMDVILAPAADAIHDAGSDLKVGGPALAHLVSGDKDWYRWLRDTLRWQGHRLDFVTHHVYDSEGHWKVTEHLDQPTIFGGQPSLWDVVVPSVREVLEERGFENQPFWLTETGWASDEVGLQDQARYYEGFLEDWFSGYSGRSWIQRVFFYELQDDPRDGVPKWGILKADGKRKKAYRAYRKFIRQHRN